MQDLEATQAEYKKWTAYIKENRNNMCSEVLKQYVARWQAYADRILQLATETEEYHRQRELGEMSIEDNDKRKREAYTPTEDTTKRKKKPRKSQKRRKRARRSNPRDSQSEDDNLHLEYEDKD